MSGLLQRLASQARAGQAQRSEPQIRAAMSAHAQVPVGAVWDDNESRSAPRFAVDIRGPETPVLQEVNHPPRSAASSAPPEHPPASEPAQVPVAISGRPTLDESRAAARLAPSFDSPRDRAPSEEAPRLPPPLLDEVRVAAPPPAIAPVATSPAMSVAHAPSDTSPEPTEVHVHIGRIEVIATPEPAAPKKPRTPIRNALSLTDYLAKRRRS